MAELVAAQPHALNPQQADAAGALEQLLAARRFAVALLHGVTGSGKTEVYLRAIHAALEAGGGVLLLVLGGGLDAPGPWRVSARAWRRSLRGTDASSGTVT